MYIHLKKEFFELHFSLHETPTHDCAECRENRPLQPSHSISPLLRVLTLAGRQLRTASNAMRFESNARSSHELFYTALSPRWIMEIAYLDQGGLSKSETLPQYLEYNNLKQTVGFDIDIMRNSKSDIDTAGLHLCGLTL